MVEKLQCKCGAEFTARDLGGNARSACPVCRTPLPGLPESLASPEMSGEQSQPPASAAGYGWRSHPKLKARFLPDHPDDLQVFVHDGGPRISRNPAEAVWVTVTGTDGDVFRGRVLNQPHNLRSVREGDEIRFIVADGAECPVMVTEKYLRERGAWVIHPCQKCGFAELFDAPSDLIRAVFPGTPPDAQMGMFTSFCPLCGGVQGVESKNDQLGREQEPAPTKRPWWQFWT